MVNTLCPRKLGVGRRDHDVVLIGKVGLEPLQVGQLLAQVDGGVHHGGELSHHDRRAELSELRVLFFEVTGDCLHQFDVLADLGVGPGVQNLDGHGVPSARAAR